MNWKTIDETRGKRGDGSKEKEERRLKVGRPICSRLYRDSCGDTCYNYPSNIFLPTTLRPGKFFYQCLNCSTISGFRIQNEEEERDASMENVTIFAMIKIDGNLSKLKGRCWKMMKNSITRMCLINQYWI